MKFTITKAPYGKGRPEFTVRGSGKKQFVQTYTPKKTVAYEEFIRYCINKAIGKPFRASSRCFEVSVLAYHPIADSWPQWKIEAALQGHIRPICKPDGDNVVKIIFDALNKVVWNDDTQIIDHDCKRRFSHDPRVEVEIILLDELPSNCTREEYKLFTLSQSQQIDCMV